MLVLTRKQGEQIRIGDDVVITVVRTKGKTVRLGIQAPGHVPVLRGEIAEALTNEQAKPLGGEQDDDPWPWPAGAGSSGNGALPSCAASARPGRGPLSQLLPTRSP